MLLLGCGGSSSDAGQTTTCVEIAEQFEAEVALLDRSCSEASDCTVAGGPEYAGCDCVPMLPAHGVRASAYVGSAARARATSFWEHGCGAAHICDPPIECICDLPYYVADCWTECVVEEAGCCHCPVDAGVTDAGTDAGPVVDATRR